MAFDVTDKFIAQVEIDGERYKVHRDMAAYELVAVAVDIDLPPAKAGSLTTRTSSTAGTLTMTDNSHGITTAALLDIYWDGGSRRTVTVGTVAGTSVPFTVGAGDNLPVATTAITAMVPVLQSVPTTDATTFTAWGAKFVSSDNNASEASAQATLVIGHGAFTEDAAVRFNLTGGVWGGVACWNNTHMEASPIAAATAMTKIYVSHADASKTLKFKFGAAVA